MTRNYEKLRAETKQRALGSVVPWSLSERSRWYFEQDRRRGYLERCGGFLNAEEQIIISQMIAAEWQQIVNARKADEATSVKAEIAYRKNVTELLGKLCLWNRDLTSATKRKLAALPSAKVPTLTDHLAQRRAAREAVL